MEVSRRGGWLFVQVATDAGLTGLGEASQGGDDGAVAETIERRLAPWLDGKTPLDVEPFWQRFASLGASRVGATALSGVEQALWGPGRAGGRAARLAPPGRAPAPPPVGLRQHQSLHLGAFP